MRALAALALCIALGACSAGTGSSSATTSSTTLGITTTTVNYVPQYVTVAGRKVLVPTEDHHEPISGYSSFGQNVIITAHGYEPHKLYAANITPIVFTNLTAATQVVYFHHFPNVSKSRPIRPGSSWSFSYPAAIVVAYGNRTGSWLGLLYIGGCPPQCGS
ncbi:MAG: hypothetical protein ABSE47_06070 [Acidimicrobiales bacterium]